MSDFLPAIKEGRKEAIIRGDVLATCIANGMVTEWTCHLPDLFKFVFGVIVP